MTRRRSDDEDERVERISKLYSGEPVDEPKTDAERRAELEAEDNNG